MTDQGDPSPLPPPEIPLRYIPVHDAPLSPEELDELQCVLEDTEGGTIGNKAAARLLASVQHVERLLLAIVNCDPLGQHVSSDNRWSCNFCERMADAPNHAEVAHAADRPWVAARTYLAARGLLPAP